MKSYLCSECGANSEDSHPGWCRTGKNEKELYDYLRKSRAKKVDVNKALAELQGQVISLLKLGNRTDIKLLELEDENRGLKRDLQTANSCISILNEQVADLSRKVNTHIGNDFRVDPDGETCGECGNPLNNHLRECLFYDKMTPAHQCFTCQQYRECFSGIDSECIFSK